MSDPDTAGTRPLDRPNGGPSDASTPEGRLHFAREPPSDPSDVSDSAADAGATLLVGDRSSVETWLDGLVGETDVAVAVASSFPARSWWTDAAGRVGAVVDATASERTRRDHDGRVVYRPATRPDTSAVLATCADVLDDFGSGAVVVDGVAPFVAADLKSAHRMVHALDSVARFAGGRLVVTMDPSAVAPHVVTLFSYAVDETVSLPAA